MVTLIICTLINPNVCIATYRDGGFFRDPEECWALAHRISDQQSTVIGLCTDKPDYSVCKDFQKDVAEFRTRAR